MAVIRCSQILWETMRLKRYPMGMMQRGMLTAHGNRTVTEPIRALAQMTAPIRKTETAPAVSRHIRKRRFVPCAAEVMAGY